MDGLTVVSENTVKMFFVFASKVVNVIPSSERSIRYPVGKAAPPVQLRLIEYALACADKIMLEIDVPPDALPVTKTECKVTALLDGVVIPCAS